MTDIVQKAEVETQQRLLCDMIAVDYVGGSTDGAKCSFALVVIIADMSGGRVHCRVQTRWLTSLLSGLCISAFVSGSDAHCSSQAEPRPRLHDFVLLLWNLRLDVSCGKVFGRRGRGHTHLVQLKWTDSVESVGPDIKATFFFCSCVQNHPSIPYQVH